MYFLLKSIVLDGAIGFASICWILNSLDFKFIGCRKQASPKSVVGVWIRSQLTSLFLFWVRAFTKQSRCVRYQSAAVFNTRDHLFWFKFFLQSSSPPKVESKSLISSKHLVFHFCGAKSSIGQSRRTIFSAIAVRSLDGRIFRRLIRLSRISVCVPILEHGRLASPYCCSRSLLSDRRYPFRTWNCQYLIDVCPPPISFFRLIAGWLCGQPILCVHCPSKSVLSADSQTSRSAYGLWTCLGTCLWTCLWTCLGTYCWLVVSVDSYWRFDFVVTPMLVSGRDNPLR